LLRTKCATLLLFDWCNPRQAAIRVWPWGLASWQTGSGDHEPGAVAKLNGHDPYAYLKDVLTRLPTHPNHRIGELLPHRRQSERA
jgi:hypothetical protein